MSHGKKLLFAPPILAVLILAAASCGSDSAGGESASSTTTSGGGTSVSIAGDWILTELTVDGSVVELPPYDLTLTVDRGEVFGDGGCNSFAGVIDRVDDGSLTISNLASTEMACDQLSFETLYLGALPTADAWTASPDGIGFSGPSFTATYRPAPIVSPAPLVGTRWRLDTVYSGEGVERSASSVDQSAAPAFLEIEGDTAIIDGDCSDDVLIVEYEEGNGGGPFVVVETAERECEPLGSNQDLAFDGVVAASGYMIDGDRLTFIGFEGETIGFVAEPG